MTASATRITVELRDGRIRHTELVAGTYLSPRPLRANGNLARVALVGSYAMLLGGDDLRIEITVGPGACLEITEPSGTVAYNARGDTQHWQARIQVAAGACLLWRGAPFVIAEGADVRRRTTIDLDATGQALLSETLVLGRSFETVAGPVHSTTTAHHDRKPLLVEDLDLRDPALCLAPGIMGGNRVLSSTILMGSTPDRVRTPCETLLQGPGAIARALSSQAHEAELAIAPSWNRWRAAMLGPELQSLPESTPDFVHNAQTPAPVKATEELSVR